MERLFGLPAHPLVVHFPVVAIPLLALALFALILRPHWLDSIGPGIAIFSVVTFVSTLLATRSGEAFSELLASGDTIDDHRTLGEQLRWIVGAQAVLAILMVLNNTTGFLQREHPFYRLLTSLAAVTSVVAIVWAIRTGHTGAEQSWGFL